MRSAPSRHAAIRAFVVLVIGFVVLAAGGASAQASGTFTVSNTSVSGTGSLRQAILDAEPIYARKRRENVSEGPASIVVPIRRTEGHAITD